jgi:hypothetical protein
VPLDGKNFGIHGGVRGYTCTGFSIVDRIGPMRGLFRLFCDFFRRLSSSLTSLRPLCSDPRTRPAR